MKVQLVVPLQGQPPGIGVQQIVPLLGIAKKYSGWIGVDLDATLAYYDGDVTSIGAPIAPMVARVKQWLSEGQEVRIFTARVAHDLSGENRWAIEAWCLEHVGTVLEVTNAKDYQMIELWDDRAVQVTPNTGIPIDETRKASKAILRKRSPKVVQAEASIAQAIAKFLRKTADRLAAKVRGYQKVRKADEPTPEQLLNKLLPIDWKPLLDELEPYMDEITVQSALQALKGLRITNQEVISGVNESAANWAAQRAAEMVGMKRVDGKLIENSNAKWAISETTRDDIAELVMNAFEARTSMSELAAQIQEAGTFSDSRARMIARTEGARAQSQGNIEGWKGSGVVESVDWVMSEDHDDALQCDCPELEAGSPYPIDDIPEIPAHPSCSCLLIPNVSEE